jgi:hypothetical protein
MVFQRAQAIGWPREPCSLVSLAIPVYPIVDVTTRIEYEAKICAVVLVANGLGVVIYRAGCAKAERTTK